MVSAWLLVPQAGAQVVSDSNQIKGTFRITNTHPDILAEIDLTQATVSAESQNHSPVFTSSTSTTPISSTERSYELTVEAGTAGSGIEYELTFGSLFVPHWIYNQPAVLSGPVEQEPAADQIVDMEQCMGMVRFNMIAPNTGDPHPVYRLDTVGYRLEPDGAYTQRSLQRSYNDDGHAHLHPDDGRPGQIRAYFWWRGDNSCPYRSTSIHFELPANICDGVYERTILVPEDDRDCTPEYGALTGDFDLVGENIHYTWWTGYGSNKWLYPPFPQPIDDPQIQAPFDLRVYANEVYSGTGLDFQRFRSSNRVVARIEPNQTTDIDDTFVMIPGRLQADAHIVGPPDSLSGGGESCIADLYRDIDSDTNGDGIPNHRNFNYGTVVTFYGTNTRAPGAILTASGGYAQRTYSGDYDPLLAEIVGDIDFAIGQPNNEDSLWGPWQVRHRFLDTATADQPDTYSNTQLTVHDQLQDKVLIQSGQISSQRDIRGCFSEVRMHFLSLNGTFYHPQIIGSATFDDLDFDGARNAYTVSDLNAYGTPASPATAADEGLVRMCLPQGAYSFTPEIVAINPGGGTSTQTLTPLELDVGCRQVVDIQSDLQLQLDEIPRCVADPNLTLTGSVNGTFEIDSVLAEVDGDLTVGCTDCGNDPAFSIPVSLNPCTNTIEVTATDSRGTTASAATTSSVDTAPPTITTPCEDLEVSVQYPAAGTPVTFSHGAVDACDGNRPVVCDWPSGSIFPIGETLVSCQAADQCGFTDACQFTVTVVERPIEDDNDECYPDAFDDEFVSGAWTLAAVGDAAGQAVDESAGELLLTGTGSSLYHDPEDHGAFLYRATDAGDFRAEIDVTAVAYDAGGQYRKATLMARASLDPDAPRVAVSYVPDFPTGPAIMFDVRLADGTAHELGSTVPNIGLPVKLAIQRVGSEVTALFHNGSAWVQPAGALGGSVTLDLGPQPLVGPMVTSYDSAQAVTFAFDNFNLCKPTESLPPTVGVCDGSDLDIVYLLDQSSSMGETFDDGAMKDSVSREVLRHVNEAMSFTGNHRGAVITATADAPPLDYPVVSITNVQGLTTSSVAVSGALASLPNPSSEDATPLADAIRRARELLENTADPARRPVVVWSTDGLPTVDGSGNGPVFYDPEEVAAVDMHNAGGTFKGRGPVAWSGDFNPMLGTFDGEAMADTMAELEKLAEAFPDVRILTLFSSTSADPGYPDLPDYAAFLSSGTVVPLTGVASAESAAAGLLDHLVCGGPSEATIAGSIWHDADGNGTVDPGESGIGQVDVQLTSQAGAAVATVTDAQGQYAFLGLTPDTYTVHVDPTDLPSTLDEATFDADGVASANQSTVTVGAWGLALDQSFGYRQSSGPLAGCELDDFAADGNPSESWTLASLGDADQAGVSVVGGELHLTGDGTTLYSGTDNGAFLYRPVTGDFVAEVDVTGFPVDAGGPYHKGGLMVREGLGATDARVMIQHIPRWNNGPQSALQFRYRASAGGPGDGALGSNLFHVPLPARLRLARIGDTFSVEFSTDGGASWSSPTGGSGGSIDLDWPETLLLGMNVVSYHPTVTTTASFDDFQVCAPEDVP